MNDEYYKVALVFNEETFSQSVGDTHPDFHRDGLVVEQYCAVMGRSKLYSRLSKNATTP